MKRKLGKRLRSIIGISLTLGVFAFTLLALNSWLGATSGFYVAWEENGRRVEYARFRIYEISYIISIASVVVIAAYLILWKKGVLRRKTWESIRRLF